MEYDKFIEKYFDPNDDSGFTELVFKRQEKLKALKVRLKKYYLTDKEIDDLFKIIINAEMEMEHVKRKFNARKYTEMDLVKFQNKLIDIQKKMKKDFEEKLNKTLKTKYEKAKKAMEELNKRNPYMQ